MTASDASVVAGALLMWVALIYVLMGSGLRMGELVWSGRQPRLLSPDLRVRSIIYATLLIASILVLARANGLVGLGVIPDRYIQSATFAVAAFLGIATIYNLGWGSRWERMLFAPITLLGTVLAGWLTFA